MFRNRFLRSLDSEERGAAVSNLREVALGGGQVLCEAGELPDRVYFPSSAVVSVVTLLRDGRAFEVSSIGFEGVANLFPALTGIAPASRTYVQIPGAAFCMPVQGVRNLLEARPSLMAKVLAYLQVNSGQSERTIACNAVHALSGRLARWLLISHDRVDVPTMALTQDYMCVMAGALRSSVSLTASAFKREGLITYSRGKVEIVDRPGLEQRACECYRSDKSEMSRLLHLG